MHIKRSVLLWTVLVLVVFIDSAASQESGDGAPQAASPAARQTVDQQPEPAVEMARLIELFMIGELDTDIDPRGLFTVSLDEMTAGAFTDLLNQVTHKVDEASKQKRRRRRPAKPTHVTMDLTPAMRLIAARSTFLALPQSEQERLFAEHEARRLARVAAEQEESRKSARLEAVQQLAARLTDYLENRLDIGIDVAPLLTLNLADPLESVLQPQRRSTFLHQENPAKEATPDKKESTPEIKEDMTELDQKLRAAEARLDAVRKHYLSLSSKERAALANAHGERVSAAKAAAEITATEKKQISLAEAEASKMAEEQRRALEASRKASSETLRMLEEERAELLGVKAAQARYEAILAKGRAEIAKQREQTLGWQRRVRELSTRSILDGNKSKDADRMYDELVSALTGIRGALRDALTSKESRVPFPKSEVDIPPHVDDAPIRTLRSKLAASAETLEASEQILWWDQAISNRDAMVSMNQSRLQLFQMLSPKKRSGLSGFGPSGIQQVRRELRQIGLEVRYLMNALPNYLRIKLTELKGSPLPLFFTLLKLMAVLVVFRWWRRRADNILEHVGAARTSTGTNAIFFAPIETLRWYLKRIRKPVEWLLLAYVVTEIVGGFLSDFRELQYIWILLWKILLWTLLGYFFVSLLNAISERQGKSSKATADLRYRSLGLVAMTVVLVGLSLSLTEVMVGRGAIFGWVISTFWLVAVPLITVLIAWWKSTIFLRAEARVSSNNVLLWVKQNQKGVSSLVAAVVGGAYLLGDGLYRFVLRQASHLAVTKKVLAYLFRREVEKQATAAADDHNYLPLEQPYYDALTPRINNGDFVSNYMSEQIAAVEQLIQTDSNTVVALLGERGLGKTTFINRVTKDVAPDEYCYVSCEPGGFDVFIRRMAATLSLPNGTDEDALVKHLRDKRLKAIFVDSAQRLIRPLIGGLNDIDRLIHFARRVGSTAAWIIALETPAWKYLSRARGDRAVFDERIMLRPWTEEEIAKLVARRSEEAGLTEYSFEKLAVPRRVEPTEMSNEDRTRQDYFRFLWDYSHGNPVVALHFWRESLFKHADDDKRYVRLFKAPSPEQLDELPNTVYFVLRAVVQLELALESDIQRCTDLSPADVADALRAAKSKGYITYVGNRVRISLHWYRAVIDMLRRQHLLLM